ncbi:MAG: four helix bundle protein, partial [Coleofasciculus sp. G3-WIS-01]
ESAETQVWLKFAVKCQYISTEQGREIYHIYNQVLRGLVNMINHPEKLLKVEKKVLGNLIGFMFFTMLRMSSPQIGKSSY